MIFHSLSTDKWDNAAAGYFPRNGAFTKIIGSYAKPIIPKKVSDMWLFLSPECSVYGLMRFVVKFPVLGSSKAKRVSKTTTWWVFCSQWSKGLALFLFPSANLHNFRPKVWKCHSALFFRNFLQKVATKVFTILRQCFQLSSPFSSLRGQIYGLK